MLSAPNEQGLVVADWRNNNGGEMGSDQVAAIRPIIAELEAADAEREGRPVRFFGSFSLPVEGGPWVEVYFDGEIIVNLWYPFQEEPLDYLAKLGIQPLPGAMVVEIRRPFCVLAFDRVPTSVLAKFIDTLFTEMYACGEDYEIDVALDTLAPMAG